MDKDRIRFQQTHIIQIIQSFFYANNCDLNIAETCMYQKFWLQTFWCNLLHFWTTSIQTHHISVFLHSVAIEMMSNLFAHMSESFLNHGCFCCQNWRQTALQTAIQSIRQSNVCSYSLWPFKLCLYIVIYIGFIEQYIKYQGSYCYMYTIVFIHGPTLFCQYHHITIITCYWFGSLFSSGPWKHAVWNLIIIIIKKCEASCVTWCQYFLSSSIPN